jgi:arylsulfatase A-like enzyme/cytochrome c-type biogenesis protein CcmH/NrfG
MNRMRRPVAAALGVLALLSGVVAWWYVSSGRSTRPRSVLLVSVDTLRADRLGSYGHTQAVTPVLDALSSRGLRFTQATTTAPLTLPAHTSLLTGTFPTFHGVRDNGGFYVDEGLTTLAEVLHTNGLRTGAFVGAFVLDRRWGLGQGFDTYFDDFDLSKFEMSRGLDAAQRPGREVVDRALAWLDEDRERPFFAWVHLYDPHSPYTPPEPYRSRFPATPQGAYDGEVAYTDMEIGRLIAALESSGRLDSTLVVVVADHGESLGEHGEQQHGFFIYDAAVHIPLIVAGPGVPAGVVADQVRIVDVMPTVLEALGFAPVADVQGQSLLPLGRGEPVELLAYSETFYPRYHYGWSELVAVRDGRFKFIAAPRRELYDLQVDPGETKDLSAENPRMADALQRALTDLRTRTSTRATAAAPKPIDADTEQRLRALGYVATTVSRATLEDKPRRDPKDTIRLYNLLKRAAQDSVEERLDEAIAKVREVLDADSEVIEAYTMLGNMHTKAGRLPEAIGAYQRALAVDPEHEGAVWSLALSYKDAGKEPEAVAGFERALQLNPRGARPLYQLADIAMRKRNFTEAAALLERGLTLDADRAAFLVRLAEVRIELQQLDAAERALTDAIGLRKDQAMAHYNLALVHEARGNTAAAIRAYEAEIAISPTLHQPHFNLARLFERAGQRDQAMNHYKAAVEANPEFGTGYLYLAKALLDGGNLQGAEQAAVRGLGLDPDPSIRPLGHFVLADVYSAMGRAADAQRQVALGRAAATDTPQKRR